MKARYLFLALFLYPAFVTPKVLAEVRSEINTSVSTGGLVEIKVENKVESSNNETKVYKRVETNINGEKKVYESTDPGSTEINITSAPHASPPLKLTLQITPPQRPKKPKLELSLSQRLWSGLISKGMSIWHLFSPPRNPPGN